MLRRRLLLYVFMLLWLQALNSSPSFQPVISEFDPVQLVFDNSELFFFFQLPRTQHKYVVLVFYSVVNRVSQLGVNVHRCPGIKKPSLYLSAAIQIRYKHSNDLIYTAEWIKYYTGCVRSITSVWFTFLWIQTSNLLLCLRVRYQGSWTGQWLRRGYVNHLRRERSVEMIISVQMLAHTFSKVCDTHLLVPV